MKFSTRDLLWLIAIAAILTAWGLERARLTKKLDEYEWVLKDEREKRVAAEGSKVQVLESAERLLRFKPHLTPDDIESLNASAPAPNPPNNGP